MTLPRTWLVWSAITLAAGVSLLAQPAPEKPRPDARFQNWLYKTPDPQQWKRSDLAGNAVFAVNEPPGDFCQLTLFADAPAEADFAAQFERAVAADQKAKGTVKIEADSGPKPSKSAEGYDVLTRNLRAETSALHTFHIYVAGRSGDRFNLAAFQTTSEGTWKAFGPQASQVLQSLKLANSLPASEVDKLVGGPAEPPPSLPGFDDGPAAPAAAPQTPAPVVATTPRSAPPPKVIPAAAAIPDRPLNKSEIVVDNAVIQKNGKPVEMTKLSQHDFGIFTPSIVASAQGVIHVAFVETHHTTYALAVYHRSSSDNGKTWTDAKNLSEDMPGIQVGECHVLVDAQDRAYVIWRAGLAVNFTASADPGAAGQSNLMYRVLDHGKWSKIKPVHPPGSPEKQNDGSLSYFTGIDPSGRVQVAWNATPDKWHPEFTHVSGTYQQHLSGIGNGLVLQATLDGSTPSEVREAFMEPVAGLEEQGGYGGYCDGLNSINGFFDAAGNPHFLAAISRNHDDSLRGKSEYALIENGKTGPVVDLPELSFHAWRDIPTLLVDAAGKRHAVVLYPAGEHPSIRDYLIGSDDEPTTIRESVGIKGTVDGMQAFQGPGGRMVAVMQMNDSGERGSGETYVSVSTGQEWSKPVNVTNNTGRANFAGKHVGRATDVAIAKSYYPGRAAATYDRDGHLLLLMINNEYSLFGMSEVGVLMTSGSSSTPTLQFLRF